MPLLGKGDPVRNKLDKTAIEFKRCISRKLLTLLGYKLSLV